MGCQCKASLLVQGLNFDAKSQSWQLSAVESPEGTSSGLCILHKSLFIMWSMGQLCSTLLTMRSDLKRFTAQTCNASSVSGNDLKLLYETITQMEGTQWQALVSAWEVVLIQSLWWHNGGASCKMMQQNSPKTRKRIELNVLILCSKKIGSCVNNCSRVKLY